MGIILSYLWCCELWLNDTSYGKSVWTLHVKRKCPQEHNFTTVNFLCRPYPVKLSTPKVCKLYLFIISRMTFLYVVTNMGQYLSSRWWLITTHTCTQFICQKKISISSWYCLCAMQELTLKQLAIWSEKYKLLLDFLNLRLIWSCTCKLKAMMIDFIYWLDSWQTFIDYTLWNELSINKSVNQLFISIRQKPIRTDWTDRVVLLRPAGNWTSMC